MQAGGDRIRFVELDSDGNTPMDSLDRSIGCHRGDYRVLNVQNPQAGFEYNWERNRPETIMRAKMRGGQMVRDGDPEYTSLRELAEIDASTPLDTRTVFGDVVLFRTPMDRVRERHEENARKSRQSLLGGVDRYVNQAQHDEREQAGQRGMSSLRFARSNHQLDLIDAEGKTRGIMRPDRAVREG